MKEEFMIGDYKVIRDNRQCSFIYVGPTEPTDKKMKSYTEEDLLCFIHDLRRNWGDLKKWLVEKSDACRLKGTATESLRWGTYDEVLNKMIGLEGRDK